MSVLCSFHNLAQLDELNTQLGVHLYALRLLDEVDVPLPMPEEFWFLLSSRIFLLSQTVHDLRAWEKALRDGRDFSFPEQSEASEYSQ